MPGLLSTKNKKRVSFPNSKYVEEKKKRGEEECVSSSESEPGSDSLESEPSVDKSPPKYKSGFTSI